MVIFHSFLYVYQRVILKKLEECLVVDMRIWFKFLGSSDVTDRNAHLVKPVGDNRKMTKNLNFMVVRDRNQLIFHGSFHSFPIFRRVQLLQDVAIADPPRKSPTLPTWPTLPRRAPTLTALPRQVGRASRCDMGPGVFQNHHGCSDSLDLWKMKPLGEKFLGDEVGEMGLGPVFKKPFSVCLKREVPLQRLIIIFPPKNCTSLGIYINYACAVDGSCFQSA